MAMIEWKLETRKISSLTPHKNNPRRMTKEQHAHLKASIDKFGLIDKPVCTIDGQVIGGHQRLKILKESGLKEVECWIPSRELTEQEVDELLIRHNKNLGEWDFDALANNFDVQDLFDWGFTAEDMGDLGEESPVKEKKEKECPHCGGKL